MLSRKFLRNCIAKNNKFIMVHTHVIKRAKFMSKALVYAKNRKFANTKNLVISGLELLAPNACT